MSWGRAQIRAYGQYKRLGANHKRMRAAYVAGVYEAEKQYRVKACDRCIREDAYCDREKPCSSCVRANLADQCAWENEADRLKSLESLKKPGSKPLPFYQLSKRAHEYLYHLAIAWANAAKEYMCARRNFMMKWPDAFPTSKEQAGHLHAIHLANVDEYAANSRVTEHLTWIVDRPQADIEKGTDFPLLSERSTLVDTCEYGQYKFPSTQESPTKRQAKFCKDGNHAAKRRKGTASVQ